jgi:hypothetical protein
MEKETKLPIYELRIEENDESIVEVDFVSLVDRPAIGRQFLAFAEDVKIQKFAIQDEDEKIISGPLMLADSPIYRSDDRGEYYVTFTKDTIKQIAQKFFRKGYQNNVNLMHDDGQMLTGLTMFESFITDEKRGIKPMAAFADVPDGSWFGSFKVDNDGAWNMIKDGKVKGFSIEGVFNYRRQENIDEKTEKLWSQILDILKKVD